MVEVHVAVTVAPTVLSWQLPQLNPGKRQTVSSLTSGTPAEGSLAPGLGKVAKDEKNTVNTINEREAMAINASPLHQVGLVPPKRQSSRS